MFSGMVEFVEDLKEKRNVMEKMIRFQDSNPEPLLARLTKAEALRGTVVDRIRIEEMTGKKSAEVGL
jgi:nitroimidazol reductase NimA-like FMN-containing flavoprotein (pyridoxamine 5'-phosphate oxidase superfamily)